ncbi:hypothetical protein L7D48_03690 [Streptomyces sp. S1A]|uniref:hypothetical protein n=1 Tax=Streptomyces sp. ICN903 TaxID=2964654 RepID=UPI001EDB55AF|nr:hypothetical protein [Streptomyces sp. ICN903]MCG3039680.1 hypothetical protein [Streptomyces sp. ICN903]
MRKLPWSDISLDHKDRTTGLGRLEIRHLKTVAFRYLDYPGARQVRRVMCRRKDLTSKEITIQRLHFVTSLPLGAATGEQLASWIRGH